MRRLACLLTLCFGLFTAVAASAATFPEASTPTDIVVGRDNAPVTIIEYGSVACPICARFDASVMPALMTKYIDTGKARFIYRPMETGNPTVAFAGHLLARCSGAKAFDVVRTIMQAQPEMDGDGVPEAYENALPVLQRIAKSVGLSDDRFKQCLTDPAGIDLLDAAHQAAVAGGVDGTPTFYINGKALDLDDFDIGEFDRVLIPLTTKQTDL